MKLVTVPTGVLLALVLLSGCGDDGRGADTDPTPGASSPTSPGTSPSVVPTPGDDAAIPPFPEVDPGVVPAGTTITFNDDGTAVRNKAGDPAPAGGTTVGLVDKDGRVSLEVTLLGETFTAATTPGDDAPELLDVQLDLGQAGSGWVVRHEGGDSTRLAVYVVRDDELVEARPDSDLLLGNGFDADGQRSVTWFTESRTTVYTRVPTGKPDEFTLYLWEVSGPGEGGAASGSAAAGPPRLKATPLGIVCVADASTGPVEKTC